MKLTKSEFEKFLKIVGAKKIIFYHTIGKITLTSSQLNRTIEIKSENEKKGIE